MSSIYFAIAIKRVRVNDSTVYSDEWLGYNALKRIQYPQFIKHGAGQYVNGRDI